MRGAVGLAANPSSCKRLRKSLDLRRTACASAARVLKRTSLSRRTRSLELHGGATSVHLPLQCVLCVHADPILLASCQAGREENAWKGWQVLLRCAAARVRVCAHAHQVIRSRTSAHRQPASMMDAGAPSARNHSVRYSTDARRAAGQQRKKVIAPSNRRLRRSRTTRVLPWNQRQGVGARRPRSSASTSLSNALRSS